MGLARSRLAWLSEALAVRGGLVLLAAISFIYLFGNQGAFKFMLQFHAPADSASDFKTFHARTRERGYILYSGKLTQVDAFRVCCIGAIDAGELRNVVRAIAQALKEIVTGTMAPVGVTQGRVKGRDMQVYLALEHLPSATCGSH
jgi:aspartate aminotransferase-like enzyme